MILPITLAIAAALAIINVWLAIRVVRLRMAGSTSSATEATLDTRMRAQANLVEYAPFFLILLVLLELAGASPSWLWVAGAVFVLARIAHPLGMDRPSPNPLRAGGAVATWVLLLLMSGWALAVAYAAHPAGGAIIVEPSSVRA